MGLPDRARAGEKRAFPNGGAAGNLRLLGAETGENGALSLRYAPRARPGAHRHDGRLTQPPAVRRAKVRSRAGRTRSGVRVVERRKSVGKDVSESQFSKL